MTLSNSKRLKRATSEGQGRQEVGIVHLQAKLPTVMALYGPISTNRELARMIVGNAEDEDPCDDEGNNLVDVVVNLLTKQWPNHKPTNMRARANTPTRSVCSKTRKNYSWEYSQRVLEKINETIKTECPSHQKTMTSEWVFGTIDKFREVFPQSMQVKYKLATTYNDINCVSSVPHHVEDDVAAVMIVPKRFKFELASVWVDRHNRIDQKFYYLAPEAVANWEGVTSAGGYALYEQCKDALEEMTTKPVWHGFFKENNGQGIVILGAGGASKDMLLIDSALSLLPSDKKLRYTIIDHSNYMGLSTYQIVEPHLHRKGHFQRVDLNLVHWDFMHLKGLRERIRPDGKNLVWIIPGNTFGNINERDFLESMCSKAVNGDLLVIGSETIVSNTDTESIQASTSHYDIPELKTFVSPALRAIWHKLKKPRTFFEVQRMVKVEPQPNRPGEANKYSLVPGAVTIVLWVPLGEDDGNDEMDRFVLLTSTKYPPEKLVQFIESFHFECEAIIDCPPRPRYKNSHYKQFVFRFNR